MKHKNTGAYALFHPRFIAGWKHQGDIPTIAQGDANEKAAPWSAVGQGDRQTHPISCSRGNEGIAEKVQADHSRADGSNLLR